MLDVFHSGIPFALCTVCRPPNNNLLFTLPRRTTWVRDTLKILINKSINSIQKLKKDKHTLQWNNVTVPACRQRLESKQLLLTYRVNLCLLRVFTFSCLINECKTHFNSDFRSKLNFKINTNLILNVPFIAPISSRPSKKNCRLCDPKWFLTWFKPWD